MGIIFGACCCIILLRSGFTDIYILISMALPGSVNLNLVSA